MKVVRCGFFHRSKESGLWTKKTHQKGNYNIYLPKFEIQFSLKINANVLIIRINFHSLNSLLSVTLDVCFTLSVIKRNYLLTSHTFTPIMTCLFKFKPRSSESSAMEVLDPATICGGPNGILWLLQRVRSPCEPQHRDSGHDCEQNAH